MSPTIPFSGRWYRATSVPARRRLVKPFPKDVFDSLRSGGNSASEPVLRLLRDRGQYEIRRIDTLRGPTDPDANPQELPGTEFLRERTEAVVPPRTASPLQPHDAQGKIQIIVKDNEVFGRPREAPVDGRHGPSTEIHVGLRLAEENCRPIHQPYSDLCLPGRPKADAGGDRQKIHRQEACVMKRPRVPPAGVPEPEHKT